jgi:hypothetical protein
MWPPPPFETRPKRAAPQDEGGKCASLKPPSLPHHVGAGDEHDGEHQFAKQFGVGLLADAADADRQPNSPEARTISDTPLAIRRL